MCHARSELQCQLLQKMAVPVVSHCAAGKKEGCHILNNVCSWRCLGSLLLQSQGKIFLKSV